MDSTSKYALFYAVRNCKPDLVQVALNLPHISIHDVDKIGMTALEVCAGAIKTQIYYVNQGRDDAKPYLFRYIKIMGILQNNINISCGLTMST